MYSSSEKLNVTDGRFTRNEYFSIHGLFKGLLSIVKEKEIKGENELKDLFIDCNPPNFKKISIKVMFKTPLPEIGIMVRVFTDGPGDLGSVPDQVIPKTLKMVLGATLVNTQHYKVRIQGKVEQSREKSCALLYTLCIAAIEKGALGSSAITVANFTYFT